MERYKLRRSTPYIAYELAKYIANLIKAKYNNFVYFFTLIFIFQTIYKRNMFLFTFELLSSLKSIY